MTERILLTGFEPFAGDATNPTQEIVHRIADRWNGPASLVTAVLPVSFHRAQADLRALIEEHRPTLVVATGLAGGRSTVGIERVALNLLDARIADNDGAQPIDEESVPGGAAALFATIPVKAIAAAITDGGIPAQVSYSAGTFVCNHVFYTARALSSARVGFVHVPWADEGAPEGAPSLPLTDLVRAIEVAIHVAEENPIDVPHAGGTLH